MCEPREQELRVSIYVIPDDRTWVYQVTLENKRRVCLNDSLKKHGCLGKTEGK
jgi:hypothetical protein